MMMMTSYPSGLKTMGGLGILLQLLTALNGTHANHITSDHVDTANSRQLNGSPLRMADWRRRPTADWYCGVYYMPAAGRWCSEHRKHVPGYDSAT